MYFHLKLLQTLLEIAFLVIFPHVLNVIKHTPTSVSLAKMAFLGMIHQENVNLVVKPIAIIALATFVQVVKMVLDSIQMTVRNVMMLPNAKNAQTMLQFVLHVQLDFILLLMDVCHAQIIVKLVQMQVNVTLTRKTQVKWV